MHSLPLTEMEASRLEAAMRDACNYLEQKRGGLLSSPAAEQVLQEWHRLFLKVQDFHHAVKEKRLEAEHAKA